MDPLLSCQKTIKKARLDSGCNGHRLKMGQGDYHTLWASLPHDQKVDRCASWKTDSDDRPETPCSVLTPFSSETPSSLGDHARAGSSAEAHASLNAAQIALVHLNDACRAQERGAFYILPEQTNLQFGHPSDLVYLPDSWDDLDRLTWDKATPIEKVDMCKASRILFRVPLSMLIGSISG